MYELPKLPYAYDSLEPYIDTKTMEIHHTKHHQTYVDKLNGAVKGTQFENMDVNELLKKINDVPENIRTAVRNHGGGHSNHTFFWQVMAPNAGGEATGKVGDEINNTFGSFDKFKEQFNNSALTLFGSGWCWLVMGKDKKLKIMTTPNQDSPIMNGEVPVLGLDLWEHSMYLKYQNRKNEYITAWWNVVNWKKVNELLENSKK